MRKILLLFAISAIAINATAQYPGQPTYHDSYTDLYLMAGYQNLNHSTGVYQTATVQSEILFSFFSSRIGFTVGPEYVSFSPCGVLFFFPAVLMSTMKDYEGDNAALGPLLMTAFSAGQFRLPISSHIEINFGWDALKFTKLKNYNDTYYITGSLNAGLTCFIGDHFFVSGYYEYNHTHNPIIKFINWMYASSVLNTQPNVLEGHSFGVRLGVMML